MDLKNKNNEYEMQLVNSLVKKNTTDLIDFAEELFHEQIEKVVISSECHRIILLAGPSASGKTTTANKLKETYIEKGHNAIVISLDDFYKDREDLPIINGSPNPEVIEALEVEMIHQALESVIETGKANLPSYDFVKGKRLDKQKQIDVNGDGILIVEGIHALNPLIHHDLDPNMVFKVYISPHSGFVYNDEELLSRSDVRFIRRLVRDNSHRGSSAENTFYMWKEVSKGEDKFIKPFAAIADFKIESTHAYEPCMFKEKAQPLLNTIEKDSLCYPKAQALIYALSKADTIDIKYLPKSSLLCEFLG